MPGVLSADVVALQTNPHNWLEDGAAFDAGPRTPLQAPEMPAVQPDLLASKPGSVNKPGLMLPQAHSFRVPRLLRRVRGCTALAVLLWLSRPKGTSSSDSTACIPGIACE